jgi:SH3 domain/CS domain
MGRGSLGQSQRTPHLTIRPTTMSGPENYEWTQKDGSLTVKFVVPNGTHKRDIALEVTSTWLEAGVRDPPAGGGGPPPVQVCVRGKLHNAVAEKKTHVQVKSGHAVITLEKRFKGQWPALFLPAEFQKGDGAVDTAAAPLRYRAAWDYAPQDEGELGFSAGDLISVVQQDNSGWWTGQAHVGVVGGSCFCECSA